MGCRGSKFLVLINPMGMTQMFVKQISKEVKRICTADEQVLILTAFCFSMKNYFVGNIR